MPRERIRRDAAVVAAVVCATLLICCSLTTSLTGLTDGVVDAGATADSSGPDGEVEAAAPDAGFDAGDARAEDATAAATYLAAVLADAPLAVWPFEEDGGTTARDVTGHGNDGVYTGTYQLGAASAFADGTSRSVSLGADGVVNMGDRFAFDGNTSFAIETWVKPNLVASRTIVKKLEFAPSLVGYTMFLTPTGAASTSFEGWVDGGLVGFVHDARPVTSNAWSHLVASADGPNARITYYVNGAFFATSALPVPRPVTHIAFTVGGAQGTEAWGLIDSVAVYGAALTQEQVSRHYAARNPLP